MDQPLLDLTIPGCAAVLTAPPRIAAAWKECAAAQARTQWRGDFLREPCAVWLTYRLPRTRFGGTALHNLLKATIDGVGSVIFAPSVRSSRPYDREDWWIVALHARKLLADKAPAVRVTVAAPAPSSDPPLEGALAHAVVPGDPPVWPADAAAQRRVQVLTADYARLLRPAERVDPSTPVVTRFDFVVDARRYATADLDNFCVPACQALAAALGEGRRPATRIVEMQATKRRADPMNPPGTRVDVWTLSGPTTPNSLRSAP